MVTKRNKVAQEPPYSTSAALKKKKGKKKKKYRGKGKDIKKKNLFYNTANVLAVAEVYTMKWLKL